MGFQIYGRGGGGVVHAIRKGAHCKVHTFHNLLKMENYDRGDGPLWEH